jgi:hypothetical protein
MKIFIFSLALFIAGASSALASEFCDGFEMGYKTVKGNYVLVPLCPLEPLTPLGSTPYQEGLKAGIKRAQSG